MPDALVRYDEEEAVFRKSLAERLWFGAILVVTTCLLGIATTDNFRGGAAQHDYLPLDFIGFLVFLTPLSIFAGPREVRFDFRQRRYRVKEGFLFFSWTRTGDFSDISHFAYWNSIKVTAVTIEWKNKKRPQTTFTRCETGSEAQALAQRLSVNVGVPAEKGIPIGFKKSAR